MPLPAPPFPTEYTGVAGVGEGRTLSLTTCHSDIKSGKLGWTMQVGAEWGHHMSEVDTGTAAVTRSSRSTSPARPPHQSLKSSLRIGSWPRYRFLCPSEPEMPTMWGKKSDLGGRRPGMGNATPAVAPISSLCPPPVPEGAEISSIPVT